jgi:ClpP class serine protease
LFRSVVEAGRGKAVQSAGTTIEKVTNGQVWLGPEAKALGLVDAVGFFDDAVNAAARLAGLTNPKVIHYTREPTLAQLLGLAQSPVEGVKLELETLQAPDIKRAAAQLLHELATPHSLYLYRGMQ